MTKKLYPESGVELTPTIARHYDWVMNLGSVGRYKRFINQAIHDMEIQPADHILDMGCGTGRNAKLIAGYLNNEGHITGLDISEDMEKQFNQKFESDNRVEFVNQRIDIPFNLQKGYDKVFISFVIHGFPNEVRNAIIQNAVTHLKPGGSFFILDFAEFDMDAMPSLHRFIFKKVECVYAFDYIKRDWKTNLEQYGFSGFKEYFYIKNYVRLLKAVKG